MKDGDTSLHVAAHWSEATIVSLLLTCGADKSLRNSQVLFSLLHKCTPFGVHLLLSLLLFRVPQGETAYDEAKKEHYRDKAVEKRIVKLLE